MRSARLLKRRGWRASARLASSNGDRWGRAMTTVQALLLGMTIAWTPGLIGLVYLLARAPEIDSDDQWSRVAEARADLNGDGALAGSGAGGLEIAKALRQGSQFGLTGG